MATQRLHYFFLWERLWKVSSLNASFFQLKWNNNKLTLHVRSLNTLVFLSPWTKVQQVCINSSMDSYYDDFSSNFYFVANAYKTFRPTTTVADANKYMTALNIVKANVGKSVKPASTLSINVIVNPEIKNKTASSWNIFRTPTTTPIAKSQPIQLNGRL